MIYIISRSLGFRVFGFRILHKEPLGIMMLIVLEAK